jgi:TetR/AcrR family transcriptional repressor of nem operon
MSPADTKTHILDIAEQLARRRGFNGFSYRDIAEPLGIKNAAVHYHFPTKADLGIAIIERYRSLLDEHGRHFLQHGGDAVLQLAGFIHFYASEICADNCTCPIGMLGSEFLTVPEAMRIEGRNLAQDIQKWMTRVLEVGREQGTMHFEGDARDKAVVVLATLQGASQAARLTGRHTLLAAIKQTWLDLGVQPAAPKTTDATEESEVSAE